jgi:predicted nucleic acid-binding protein
VAYLIDTSILARLANSADAQHADAVRAVLQLHRSGELMHVTPQVLIEFRNVATRPKAQNGLQLSTADTEVQVEAFETVFPLVGETPDIYPRWKELVTGLAVIGKRVHDARLVAVCHTHGITHLLTFNMGHFLQMARAGPGVEVVHPVDV